MFSLTLLEHLRLVRKDITEEEVWDLLASLSVAETVRRKGEGLLCLMNHSEGLASKAGQNDNYLFPRPLRSGDCGFCRKIRRLNNLLLWYKMV